MANENIKEQQTTDIKALIIKGREQGYLTFAEVNDHLPDDIVDPEQLEDIIGMINEMGIEVHEAAPDTETIRAEAPATGDDDETVTEDAVAVLSAVDAEVGRTTDPVRMYMREMGTVELLTREGEIVIAKRIEEGLKQVQAAVARFPWSAEFLIEQFELHQDGKKRLSEVISGFSEVDDIVPPPVRPPVATETAADAATGDDAEADEDEAGEEEEEAAPVDTGPDPVEVAKRVDNIRNAHAKFQKAAHKNGLNDPKAGKLREDLAEAFLTLKLPVILIDNFVRKLRDVVGDIRACERNIMDICIRQSKMPRKEFLKAFPSNETNLEWADELGRKRQKWSAALRTHRDALVTEQEKLVAIEKALFLNIADIKEINRAMLIGET
ncbi:MAG: RNA polymerase sigma factor region1.1 domain-containing protein, partial [Dokdonella sp.]